MSTESTPNVLATSCLHLTEAAFVDGEFRTPDLCDACIIENASVPLTDEEAADFAQATVKLADIVRREKKH